MPVIPFQPVQPPIPPGAEGFCGWDVDPLDLCEGWADYTEAQQDLALSIAVSIMWAATGRRFGPCEITIRPCQSGEVADGYRAYPVWWGSGSEAGPMPFLFGGEWFNSCGCGSGCCCKANCEIVLPGPVASVEQVIVRGEVLDVAEYRVDVAQGVYYLVKTSAGCWPTCQDFNEPGDGDNGFQVTYTRGTLVPDSVLGAAAILACELAKSIVGALCALPQRLQSLTRQGVTAEFVVNELDLDVFQTGIAIVDMVIRAQNPGRRVQAPMLFSPDAPTTRDRMTILGG